MRPILALAIVLVGLNGATPETKYQEAKYQDRVPATEAEYQDRVLATDESSFSSDFETTGSIGKSDRVVVAVASIESSDAAHDQDEEAAEPPQLPALASTDADADADVADSLDGLCSALMTSAQDNDLPVPFFANLIWQESRLRHDEVSKVGALGIAQFMPEVAVEVGLADPFDPRQALPASARFLRTLRLHFGNLGFVAAAYNAGAHRVGEWLDHRRPLPQETRTYVLRVTGRSAEAWRKSPPDDSKLTFVRHLPCRDMPAFADLEQAQLKEAQEDDDSKQSEPRQERVAAKVAHFIARKVSVRVAAKVAQRIEKTGSVARPLVAERKQVLIVVRAAAASKMARNLRGGKREATRPQHVPHEKRRVA